MANYLDDSYGTLGKNLITEQATNCPWTPDMSMAEPFGNVYTDICTNSQFQGFGGTCYYAGKTNVTTNPQWANAFGGLGCDGSSVTGKPCIIWDLNGEEFRISDPQGVMGTNPCDTGCDWDTTLPDGQGDLSFQSYECYGGAGSGSCVGKCDGVHGTNIFNLSQSCDSFCNAVVADQTIGCIDQLATNYGSGSGTGIGGIQYGLCISNGLPDPTACIGCDYDASCSLGPPNPCNSGTPSAGNDGCCTYLAGSCLDSRDVQNGSGGYIATNSKWAVGLAYPGGFASDCGQVGTATLQLDPIGVAPWYGFPQSSPVDLSCCSYPAANAGVIGCLNPSAINYNAAYMFDCSTVPVQYYDDAGASFTDPLGQTPDTNPNSFGDESCCGWVGGCTDPGACNYNPLATLLTSCNYTSCAGCTNPIATNYDASATIMCNDTGNSASDNYCCQTHVTGCPDSTAMNYEPTSTVGCTSAGASLIVDGYDFITDNTLGAYNTWPSWSTVTTSANSGFPNTIAYMDCATNTGDVMCDCCTYHVYGCTDSQANNYSGGANTDDGSCTYEGCPNILANNYWLNTITPTPLTYAGAGCTTNGTWTLNDDTALGFGGCCVFPMDGCTDDTACNYNQYATSDDGSCCTTTPCESCQEATAFNTDPNVPMACISDATLCVYQGCTDSGTVDIGGSNPSPFPNVAAYNYLLTYTIDGNGDDITDGLYSPATGWNSNCEYEGCKDTDATNYDSNNTGCDDGSSLDPADVDCCNYNVGCSDSTAANYTDSSGLTPAFLIDCNSSVPPHLQVAYGSNSLLTVSGENYVDTLADLSYDALDNNDCCEIITGCMDDDADNYNSSAGVAGPCEYLIGCTDSGYSNSITNGYGSSTSATPIACNANGTTTGSFGPYGDETGYLPGDASYTGTPDCCEMYGCTDQGLDPAAQTMPADYGNYVAGVGAINYDVTATIDNGSCNYIVYGCNDTSGGAINTEPYANYAILLELLEQEDVLIKISMMDLGDIIPMLVMPMW